ncbi:uncharacterized protein [Drosophila tropicalis]|uniref:uncharacterized protein n=1 Tax=Drosophila tropicalis TaxID=46794 RepID=UPI0035AB9517
MPTINVRLAMPTKRMWGQISLCGAFLSLSTVLYMNWRLQDRVRNSDYYKLAIQTLRQHKGAVGLLGEPIKESGFSLYNMRNTCDADKAQFQVTVHGTKDKGTVYFWASNNHQGGWLIDRLELETKQHPHTRFLLKKPQYMLEEQAKVVVIEVPEPKPISLPTTKPAAGQAMQMPKQSMESVPQQREHHTEQQPEQPQQSEPPLEHNYQEQEHQEHEGYETPNYQQPNPTYAQPLHQQQGQEPLPYIQTAEGGRME